MRVRVVDEKKFRENIMSFLSKHAPSRLRDNELYAEEIVNEYSDLFGKIISIKFKETVAAGTTSCFKVYNLNGRDSIELVEDLFIPINFMEEHNNNLLQDKT